MMQRHRSIIFTFFCVVLQDLLHISEYDLLEAGVHNHLHRLHLLTSLRLLQERERRRGKARRRRLLCPLSVPSAAAC